MNKNIVVCLDGTWNANEQQNTNVHRIYSMLDKSRTTSNYWSGVGVGGWALGNALDAAMGRGAFRIMRSAFTFIKGNYQPGDQIYIFGFSRGAFTARHLAGMITRLGIGRFAEETYDRYRTELAAGTPPATRQEIQFLGMFDCVPGNQIYCLNGRSRVLNAPLLEPGIKNVAHAVSRDERRWSFAPIFFVDGGQKRLSQRWLPGYHFDVGGDDNPPLNAFALWWMIREAYGCGLDFELIRCQTEAADGFHHGMLGVKLGFMGVIDSEAPGKPSDWLTTKLGLRCPRPSLPGSDRVEPQPDLADMVACSRGCDEDMFEFFLTPEGNKSLTRLMTKHQRG